MQLLWFQKECLSATPRQAVAPALRAALRSSMIPSINGMMTVGLVSLPGMMTGQMLGGADPSVAARYQLMIVFVLAGATSAVAVSLSILLYHSFFTSAWQLRTELLASEKEGNFRKQCVRRKSFFYSLIKLVTL
ncbi:UPF0014 membrane protein [Galdieria sulphuraria]|nr:UPF0014 membrane protein [Galdieria sulphuraria]